VKIIREHSVFVTLLMGAIILGFFIAGNYGETADDLSLQIYAKHTVDVYETLLGTGRLIDPGYDILSYYGPAFLTFTHIGQNLLGLVAPAVPWLTSWHFFIFLSFLIGVAAIYNIGLRLFAKPVAVAIAVLYATQPVLWGQGFVNIKDVPLMSFFLLSLALGLRLESYFQNSGQTKNWRASLEKKWKKIASKDRRRLTLLARNLGVFAATLFLTSFLWPSLIGAFVDWIAASPETFLGKLFVQIAPNAGELPLSGYVDKAVFYLGRFAVVIVILWFAYTLFSFLKVFRVEASAVARSIKSTLWTSSLRFWRSPVLWAAALAAGFTAAIRVVGPFAAVLVVIFLFWKKGPAALSVIIPYMVIAGLTTLLLWPYLWISPIQNFMDSIHVMSDFPWSGRVLFAGDLIPAQKLPVEYLPTLLGIQVTLPALALIFGGLVIALRKLAGSNQALIATLLLWFWVPLIYVIMAQPTMYHNFRQFFFIMPPLFILAGFGFDWIYRRLNSAPLFWALVLLAALPGIVAIVQLHPYEYVYYNELVGGVRGAEGRYELEYWATSLTEATRQLNQIAPANSFVVSWGSLQIVQRGARPDLRLETLNARNYDPDRDSDYVIVPIRAARGRYFFAGFPETVVIERAGVALAVVNQLNCECATFNPSNTQNQ
jgi:hypothetical protein